VKRCVRLDNREQFAAKIINTKRMNARGEPSVYVGVKLHPGSSVTGCSGLRTGTEFGV
jgi:hypothetical protein